MDINSEHKSPRQLAWIKYKKNKPAMCGLVVLVFAILIAILGSLIRPDISPNANNQQLELAKAPMNFSVQSILIRKNQNIEIVPFYKRILFGGQEPLNTLVPLDDYEFIGDRIVIQVFSGQNQLDLGSQEYHILDVIYSIDLSTLRTTNDTCYAKDLQGNQVALTIKQAQNQILSESFVNERFLFGTDKFGRDLLSRLMAGTIISLSVGLISVLISLFLGVTLGAVAGYFGGIVDDMITWLINVVWSIPTLLLVIAITFALGKGFVQVFIAVGLTMWVEVARVVRGQIVTLKNMEYIQAAKALGYSHFRIIFIHLIPNAIGPVIVISAANFASAILLEAGLSFLGIGAQIPMASWGQMINEHYIYITTSRAHLAILPGLSILTLVLAFMLIGNGLRDSLDTRTA